MTRENFAEFLIQTFGGQKLKKVVALGRGLFFVKMILQVIAVLWALAFNNNSSVTTTVRAKIETFSKNFQW